VLVSDGASDTQARGRKARARGAKRQKSAIAVGISDIGISS